MMEMLNGKAVRYQGAELCIALEELQEKNTDDAKAKLMLNR